MCQFIAMALFGSGIAHAGTTPQAFTPAWFATKQPGATPPSATAPRGNNGNNVSFNSGSALLQQRVQQSIQNLNNAAAAVAAQMQAQKDAQSAAQQLASNIPDGLGNGGLTPSAGIGADPSLWQNANAPTDTVAGGKHTVEVKQTAQKAILTWDSFNVGRNTTLYFNQSGGTQSDGTNDWIALNRINDPSALPSQILGQIKSEGSVYLLNRNGFLFGAGSQVNTHSLIASSLSLFSDDLQASNQKFLDSGIATNNSNLLLATFTDGAKHDVVIEKGASITSGPEGFVLIAAPDVSNAGSIVADDGQAILAATNRLTSDTTNDRLAVHDTDQVKDVEHTLSNTGIIQARRGSVELHGRDVLQSGVLLASTSISHPGTIAIYAGTGQASATDITFRSAGNALFSPGSVTAVLPEKDGSTTSSTDAADKAFVSGSVAVHAGQATLAGGSLIEAPGASVSITAVPQPGVTVNPDDARIYIDNGATIDVSGLPNVMLPMSALLVTIPRIGQNELADSPLLRNSFLYTQKNVVIDSTVSGTRADGLDWIGSPILNAAGYVENVPRDVSQMLTKGGDITLSGQQVITRTGSHLKLDGGYIAYQPGWIDTPNLLGADGRIYNIADADPNVDYVGFAGQYTNNHARWGVSETYNSPVMGGSRRWDEGFIDGADAGTLTVNAYGVLALDGDVSAQAFAGERQVGNGTQPAGGTFVFSDAATAISANPYQRGVRLQESSLVVDTLYPGFTADTLWETSRAAQGEDPADDTDAHDEMILSTDMLGKAGFANVNIASTTTIVDAAGSVLAVQPGGNVSLSASRIDIFGGISAPAGNIALTTSTPQPLPGAGADAFLPADITIADGASLSTRGMWVNDSGLAAGDLQGDRYINGGSISLTTQQAYAGDPSHGVDGTGNIDIQKGSVLDVSGGGYVDAHGRVKTVHDVPEGRGGDISIRTYATGGNSDYGHDIFVPPSTLDGGRVTLDGTLQSYGFEGGGNLTLQAPEILIGGDRGDLVNENGLWLDPSFFQGKGFDNYTLHSVTDATVAAGTHVSVERDNLIPDIDALRFLATGSDLYSSGAASIGRLDAYHRWATRNTSDGHGPGFSLAAGDYLLWQLVPGTPAAGTQTYAGVTGSVLVDHGASIDVDAGGTVSLQGTQATIVHGSVRAPGGAIDVSTQTLNQGVPAPKLTTRVWLGDDALLDASGIALIDPMAAPAVAARHGVAESAIPRTGALLDGGQITLESNSGYVVAEQGAVLDVSGTTDHFDLPMAAATLNGVTTDFASSPVWSNGGGINMFAAAGLLSDATLRAQGGDGGSGGSLTIGGEGIVIQPPVPPYPLPTGILVQQSGQFVSPDATEMGQIEDGAPSGILHLAVDSLAGTGIDNLVLGGNGGTPLPVGFAGDVNLSLGRSFVVNASSINALAAGATAFDNTASTYTDGLAHVHVSAPYVSLFGVGSTSGTWAGDGALAITADTIDIGGNLNLQGWNDASFAATGDIRFVAPNDVAYVAGNPVTGTLFSTGNLTFQAAQLYPATDYRFAVIANASGIADAEGLPRETTISVLPNGPSQAPLSAGGSLLLDADHIEQAGTIRVPSGNLVLGVGDPAAEAAAFGLDTTRYPLLKTTSVHLAPGSLTSVSLDGLTVPYGTTTDGTQWRYNGSDVQAADLTAPPSKQVALHGDDLALDQGATIDLSGGGSLQAGEWVPGTGGSRDVLAQRATVVDGAANSGAPQYADGRAIYAIMPGHQTPVAAYDSAIAAQGGDGPSVGQQVYLSGIPGLPAGYYTLLPARYAELPGAYRVVQDTSATNSVLGRSARQADGTYAVTGYFGDALTGKHDALNSTFLVQSRDVWTQYSQYTFSDADTYFGDKASKAGEVAPRLAADAGRLMIDAGSRLDLGLELTGKPAEGGRSSQVDITADAIQILGADEQARDGYLSISADGLTRLGAGSLLIGGTRASSAEGDLVSTTANSVLLSNDAAHPLSGEEVILVARGDADASGIELESGSVLTASGTANPVGSQPLVFGVDPGKDATGNATPAIAGDGSMLRVSQNGAAPVIRHQITGLDGAPGTSSGMLTIDAGATIQGGSALTLDATGKMHVSEDATFGADAIDANANRIAFVGAGVNGGDDGLVIGSNTLNLFRNANEVTLRSRSEMDFLGNLDISLDHALTLNAGALVGDGGNVTIEAARLGFGNALNAVAGDTTPIAGGRLDVRADEIDFGAGSETLRGFNAFSGTASQGMLGQGAGGMDFGGASVDLSAPLFLADTGSSTLLKTTGAMRLIGTQGTPLTRDTLGGGISFQGGSVDVSMDLTAVAGTVSVNASQGDVHVASGTTLDVAGVVKDFYDTKAFAPGGDLSIVSDHGAVNVDAGSSLKFGGGDEGGDAGSLTVSAAGAVNLSGALDGHAKDGYRGAYFTSATGGAVDLDSLNRVLTDAGVTGLMDITSGSGDLNLSAGNNLRAGKVYLYANGGTTRIDGTVDASGPVGGEIELYGRNGVDVEGSLLASSSIGEQRGGDVVIGTTGQGSATDLDATYGYENVQRANAGLIHIGANARIDVSGGSTAPLAGGRISFRAPLLADHDVPIQIDNAQSMVGARDVTIEPFAVWSTADQSANAAQHFDGIVDPAGWYVRDPSGKAVLVEGTWTNAKGVQLDPPKDDDELKTYLSENFFTPKNVNADHAGFYGYAGGDAANGPGTLMGFIENPLFAFGGRYSNIANIHVRPGVELDNPADATGVDGGAIRVLTNWNLGAGTTGNDGRIALAYRFGAEAPVLTFRAGGDIDIEASISDGFYQQNTGAVLADPAKPPTTPPPGGGDNGYGDALLAYQQSLDYMDSKNIWNNGSINLKIGAPSGSPAGTVVDLTKDPNWAPLQAPLTNQTASYYANYDSYIDEIGNGTTNQKWAFTFNQVNAGPGFLIYSPKDTNVPVPGADYADYVTAYQAWLGQNFFNVGAGREKTPVPLMAPIDTDYNTYSSNYGLYITGHFNYYTYVSLNVGNTGFGSQLFYAPFAPRGNAAAGNAAYDQALAAYQSSLAYVDSLNAWDNGLVRLKASSTPLDLHGDPNWVPVQAPQKDQSANYYTNYGLYIGDIGDGSTPGWASAIKAVNNGSGGGFLTYAPTSTGVPSLTPTSNYSDYVTAYQAWLQANFFNLNGFRDKTPVPLMQPLDTDYSAYTDNYATYINGHVAYYTYVSTNVGNSGFGSQLFYAPFAPNSNAATPGSGTTVPIPVAAANNSPSNMPSLGNPVPFASATLMGGSSTSLRLVAGADMASADPLAVQASGAGNVTLDGHFEVKDTLTDTSVLDPRSAFAGKTLLFPTTIRTGTGSIDIVSAGDIRWMDDAAPAAIYTAGAPSDGTTAGTDVSVLRPAVTVPGTGNTVPDMLVSGLVNPDNAGDIKLSAGGDIDANQNPVDIDGSVTKGAKGTSIAQYWWQWMQIGNAADGSQSSIDFANFAQGVMSVGGNVSVDAGGNISELFVSLPTTWYANETRDAVTTVGGGNLDVHAGGDILSGGYFVARGLGDIRADGSVRAAADLSAIPLVISSNKSVTTPVSTIVALQDAQVSVDAVGSVDIGGVYNPSYLAGGMFPLLLPAGHADNQPYSTDSSIDISATTGDVVFGSLKSPAAIFGATGSVAGPVLPATVSMKALGGGIDVLTDGALYPSASGNLTMLATGDIGFSRQTINDSTTTSFGLIDKAAAGASPLNPDLAQIGFGDNVDPSTSHDLIPLHGDDDEPVRIYSLNGDITDGITAPNGFNYLSLTIAPAKQALIYAGRDIVNLTFIGQHTRDADITRIAAGRDIYDTAFVPSFLYAGFIPNGYNLPPRLLLGGPGNFLVEAGRDIGPLTNQLDVSASTTLASTATGIQSVGNLFNAFLPHEGADVNVAFGVGPGVDTAGFLARYLDQPDVADGFGNLDTELVAFMERRVAGKVVDTGYAKDKLDVTLSVPEARALLAQEPEYVQRLFAERALFKMLAQVGNDYNDAGSPFAGKYARGYAAIDALFPSAYGYTSNGAGEGGLNGAETPVSTGNLDIRSTTIQTQQGGDVTIVGPGGQALVGSTSAPSQITNPNTGAVVAGPNTMGILTLEKGDINLLTDRSVLLAQSRIFTEQGGNVTIWSSNGDINAGQGAKTTSEIPPPTYVCNVDATCRIDARGQVSGAGIATIQSVEGAEPGNAYLVAPRGTVDAGDAGIRVSGDIVIAAARVANADNIQVKGDAIGVPVTAAVNVGALNAASAAASAATKAAEDVARQQQSDARDHQPSIISVNVLRDGNNGASTVSPDATSPVNVLGSGHLTSASAGLLTPEERKNLR